MLSNSNDNKMQVIKVEDNKENRKYKELVNKTKEYDDKEEIYNVK